MAEKQLLIEASEFGLICNLSNDEKNRLTESLKVSKRPNDCLLVKGVPSTRLDIKNQNGRIYPTALMQKAIDEARPQMESKMLVCSGDEHPTDSTFPRPSTISHVVVNAYIKNVLIESNGKKERQNVLFCDFLVLPTVPHGVNMQKFILEGIGCGISIRGLGECDRDGTVTSYSLLGADLVGMPSSSVYLSTPIGESVSVSVVPENTLTETYVVSASATNVVRDLDSALALSQQIDSANFGTVKKTSTKLDSEVDPKTGAETTMVTLETETEDEVSDIDQALMMAKQAMMNGKADIDSVTIENVKEEQPKESAENSEAPLNEDNDKEGHYAKLPHLTPITNYILKNYPKDSEAYKAALRIQNDLIANRLEDRQAALEELKKYIDVTKDEYVPESIMDEAGVDKLMDEIRSIMYNEGLSLEQACRKYCEYHENIPYEYVLEYMRPTLGESDNFIFDKQSVEEELKKLYAIDKSTLSDEDRESLENRIQQLEGELRYENLVQNESAIESTITEAKEEKQEDPNNGKQFVLKTNQGFVAMDGNALKFVEKPKDAIHFVKGKEESGVIHLSGIEKILDTMGVYDVEKYYKKGTTDISVHDDVNVLAVNTNSENKDGAVEECGDSQATMTEDNGSNTKYQAVVEIVEPNGSRSSETIPVSAVDMEGINKEIGNLYDMKSQNGSDVNITVVDTATGQSLVFNKDMHQVEAAQMESAGDLEQNGNKLSMEVDDDNKVEKEFKTPAQAAVAKAGIESGKFGGDVLLSEEDDDDEDETDPHAECEWCGEEYALTDLKREKDLGLMCPVCRRAVASRVSDPLEFSDVKMNEVMYNKPGEASDPYIEKPLNEDDTSSINITFRNIDWNNEDLMNKMVGNMEDDDPVNIGDIESKVKDLPDEATITVRIDEIPMTDDASLERFLFNKLGEKYAMKVNNAELADVNWVD